MALSKVNQNLLEIAELYLGFGYSVIPVRSDKTPTISWKSYQSRRMDIKELEDALHSYAVVGLAIIMGRISQLAVLDFDEPQLYQQFCLQFPRLAQTRTIQTRRGFHLYFKIPDDTNTQSMKVKGIDWLWEGHYAITYPSNIGGHRYSIKQGGRPISLTQDDIQCIEGFMGVPESAPLVKVEPEPVPPPSITLSAENLIARYHIYAQQGRNNALFSLACFARDCGWTSRMVEAALLDVFIADKSTDETVEKRHQEGQRSIASAFIRPRQKLKAQYTEPQGLPNTVREALLQGQQTYAVRTLDGLRQAGIEAGDYFTEATAREALQGIVGQHSIRQTLVSGLLKRVENPPDPHTFVAWLKDKDTISLCKEISCSKSKLIQSGRKIYYYQMPSNSELAHLLGVKLTRISDQLTSDDLSSARSTRQANYREFIRRRPGLYANSWLASRMGVSVTTKNRYDQDIPIHKKAMYIEYPVTWSNLGWLPDKDAQAGIFLEDNTGKRYPALRAIAGQLLKWGRVVMLKQQTFNFYSVGNSLPIQTQDHVDHRPKFPAPHFPRVEAEYPPESIKKPFSADLTAEQYNLSSAHQNDLIPSNQKNSQSITSRVKSRRKLTYRRQLKDANQEAYAKYLYEQIQQMGQASFSMRSARRLVDLYGTSSVKYALWRVQQKSKLSKLSNPVGLLTVIARTQSQITHIC